MAAKTFFLEIVTPEKKAFSGDIEFAVFPGAEGLFGILPHHAPMLCALQPGEIKILHDKQADYFAVSGGFVEVRSNKVTVVADTCEAPSEIDAAEALAEKKSALEDLQKAHEKNEGALARQKLMIAEVRINVAEKTVGQGNRHPGEAGAS
jgi:F-type H+-transporting ATPase subunit epsilon